MKHLRLWKGKLEVVKNNSTSLWRVNWHMASKLHNLDVTWLR